MLAREAVLKAIHKLHDQRVLSDKARLLARSARLPSANEKFQAFVETCGVQKSQGKIDSANGSPGMEGPEVESKHSSYSTTSGSVETTQQDSRSSQDVKETGMDVERPHRFSSPDLNLNLDSNLDTDSHMPGLNVVNPLTTVSVLGVEGQTNADRPSFPLHFHGPGSDLQGPGPTLRLPENSSSDPAMEYPRRVPLLFTSQSSSATVRKDDFPDDSSTTLTRRLDPDKEQ